MRAALTALLFSSAALARKPPKLHEPVDTTPAVTEILAPKEDAVSEPAKGPVEENTGADYADGTREVKELIDRNEKAIILYAGAQNATPYVYPREKLVLGAPWGNLFSGLSDAGPALLATFAPQIGVSIRSGLPLPAVSWPWAFPIGPAFHASRARGDFRVFTYKPFRLVLEPVLWLGKTVTFSVRGAARVMVHPTKWPVGIGGGLGSTVMLTAAGASISPEFLVQIGRCCEPGYVTLCARADLFVNGAPAAGGLSVGYTYF